jgi:hypothetical protein
MSKKKNTKARDAALDQAVAAAVQAAAAPAPTDVEGLKRQNEELRQQNAKLTQIGMVCRVPTHRPMKKKPPRKLPAAKWPPKSWSKETLAFNLTNERQIADEGWALVAEQDRSIKAMAKELRGLQGQLKEARWQADFYQRKSLESPLRKKLDRALQGLEGMGSEAIGLADELRKDDE